MHWKELLNLGILTLKVKRVKANNLNFAYYELGKGPLILCLHGFPDTADTWLELIPKLAGLGYRVVAPFMRGYAPTEIPVDHSYTSTDLGSDILALIEALNENEAILIGHDWGALASYAAANMSPGKIKKLITLAIPHPLALRLDLRTLIKARHFITFQFRHRVINQLTRNNFKFLEKIVRRWSPNWAFTEDDLAPVKACFAQAGVPEAALGYYWSFAESLRSRSSASPSRKRSSVPTLTLIGASDGTLSLDVMSNTPQAFTDTYEYHIIPKLGHFLHREAPKIIFDFISDFLSSETH